MLVGQVEFPPTVEANFVCAALNREHTAEVAVAAAKDKMEEVDQRAH